MKMTFQKYLPLVALATGFVSAFITAGVHSMLFVIPVLGLAVLGCGVAQFLKARG